jgi:phage tail sheath protein FI
MPTVYKTPGVYIEEISTFPPSIAQVETAIPAFIGYTEIAKIGSENLHANLDSPIIRPVRITSLLEYEQYFGKALPEPNIVVTVTETDATASFGTIATGIEVTPTEPSPHNMYYALQAYFANGGGPCYIVSVGPMATGDTATEIVLGGTSDDIGLLNGLNVIRQEDEITLIVFPQSLSLIDVDAIAPGNDDAANNANAAAYADYKTLFDAALQQCQDLQDRFVVMDAYLDTASISIVNAANIFRTNGISTDNLKYGAAYGPRLETIFTYLYNESDVNVILPDATAPITMNVLNPTDEDFDRNQNGENYPRVQRAISQLPLVLAAAPLVVGAYAKTDNARGVWKAPANVALTSVIKPTVAITNAEQDSLNVDTTGKSINAIRAFTGKGTLIWGARTLDGNSNEWRYVPVRRFFNMAEESIKKATEQFVFEPNDANTWTKVRAMIENFLTLQWRAGALAGAKPEQAFYVKVGLNETMTALDILEGRMIVEIGMAVVRPAEFIILRFSHKMQES